MKKYWWVMCLVGLGLLVLGIFLVPNERDEILEKARQAKAEKKDQAGADPAGVKVDAQ